MAAQTSVMLSLPCAYMGYLCVASADAFGDIILFTDSMFSVFRISACFYPLPLPANIGIYLSVSYPLVSQSVSL